MTGTVATSTTRICIALSEKSGGPGQPSVPAPKVPCGRSFRANRERTNSLPEGRSRAACYRILPLVRMFRGSVRRPALQHLHSRLAGALVQPNRAGPGHDSKGLRLGICQHQRLHSTTFSRFSKQPNGAIVSNRPIPADRRLKVRYPLDLGVRFRSLSGRSRFSGAGRTVNMSSGGVLVVSEHVAQTRNQRRCTDGDKY